jgi:hypothetical protein
MEEQVAAANASARIAKLAAEEASERVRDLQAVVLSLQTDMAQQRRAAAAAAANQPHASVGEAAVIALLQSHLAALAAPQKADPALLAAIRLQTAAATSSPPSFFGKTQNPLELRGWLSSVTRYLDSAEVTDDAVRVSTAARLLKGTASTWWTTETLKPEESRAKTWTEFEAAMKRRFEPLDSSRWARGELDSLVGRKHHSVSDFTTSFMELVDFTPTMSEEDRIFAYMKGLPPYIQTSLATKASELKDLSSVTSAALRIEANRNAQSQSSSSSGASYQGPPNNRFNQQRSAYKPAHLNQVEEDDFQQFNEASDSQGIQAQLNNLAAEIKAMAARNNFSRTNKGRSASNRPRTGGLNPGPTPGLSAELAKARFEKGLCIRCGSNAHFKAACISAADTTTQPK